MTDLSPYWTLPGLEDLYLEDSWILDIRRDNNALVFEIDIVLRDSHPEYRPPSANEQYCYRRGLICFNDVSELRWTTQARTPAVDATGESDYGSFDEFATDGSHFRLRGDFGDIDLQASLPVVTLLDQNSDPNRP